MNWNFVIFLAAFISLLNTPDFEQLWITYCDLKRAQMNNIGARIAFKWDLSGCRRRDISGRRLIWPSEGRIWYLTGRDNRPQVEGKHHQELAVCNRPNLEAKLTLDDLMLTGPDIGYFWMYSTLFLSSIQCRTFKISNRPCIVPVYSSVWMKYLNLFVKLSFYLSTQNRMGTRTRVQNDYTYIISFNQIMTSEVQIVNILIHSHWSFYVKFLQSKHSSVLKSEVFGSTRRLVRQIFDV